MDIIKNEHQCLHITSMCSLIKYLLWSEWTPDPTLIPAGLNLGLQMDHIPFLTYLVMNGYLIPWLGMILPSSTTRCGKKCPKHTDQGWPRATCFQISNINDPNYPVIQSETKSIPWLLHCSCPQDYSGWQGCPNGWELPGEVVSLVGQSDLTTACIKW